MHQSINNLVSIQNTLKIEKKDSNQTKIIAVSKTFPINEILPLINHGQVHFGENKVQEALEKWQPIKQDFKHLQLHMIGKLQSNKVKFVVGLFDYIHSLDSLKLAKKISEEQKKLKKKLKIFIQINIGNESQKSGIDEAELNEFYKICKDVNTIGEEIKIDTLLVMALEKSIQNFDNGIDYILSKDQIVEIVIELKLPELVETSNPKEVIEGYIQKTKFGNIILN